MIEGRAEDGKGTSCYDKSLSIRKTVCAICVYIERTTRKGKQEGKQAKKVFSLLIHLICWVFFLFALGKNCYSLPI